MEKEIYAFGCQIACEILKNVLETMDKKLSKERDKSIYRHKGTRQTTVKTLMGEVAFSRALYKSIGETELAKAAENNQLRGEKEVSVLFEEADVVYINIQGKDRPKSDNKLKMKVSVAYEGWKRLAMIAIEYNVDEIQMRILNGTKKDYT